MEIERIGNLSQNDNFDFNYEVLRFTTGTRQQYMDSSDSNRNNNKRYYLHETGVMGTGQIGSVSERSTNIVPVIETNRFRRRDQGQILINGSGGSYSNEYRAEQETSIIYLINPSTDTYTKGEFEPRQVGGGFVRSERISDSQGQLFGEPYENEYIIILLNSNVQIPDSFFSNEGLTYVD